MYKKTPGGHMGADWVKNALRVENMSELGEKVADLLGDLFFGIYHLDDKKLKAVDWSNTHHIEFALGWKSLSTFDGSELTRLVLLAHQRAIRVQISPRSNHYITLMFHAREHGAEEWWKKHPTIAQAVERFEKVFKVDHESK